MKKTTFSSLLAKTLYSFQVRNLLLDTQTTFTLSYDFDKLLDEKTILLLMKN